MHVLREHNGTKTDFYQTNTKSQGLVPAHFALMVGNSKYSVQSVAEIKGGRGCSGTPSFPAVAPSTPTFFAVL